MVDSLGHLEETRALRRVSDDPVWSRKGGCVVGRLLPTASLEAEKGMDGQCHVLIYFLFMLLLSVKMRWIVSNDE